MNLAEPREALAREVRAPRGLLERDDAEAAIELALPSVRAALARQEVSGEGVLHIVVMDPCVRPPDAFDAAVLAERSVGDPARWGADYRRFARAKAELGWRHARDTRELQEAAPHLIERGDTLLWGSAWRDGIVVAASGAHPWYDEAFSHTVAAFLVAIAHDKARALRRAGLFFE
jgi:hypothetical protein